MNTRITGQIIVVLLLASLMLSVFAKFLVTTNPEAVEAAAQAARAMMGTLG